MQNLEHYQLSCNLECDTDKSQIKQRLKDWGRLFTQRKQTIVWFETHQFYDFHTCFSQQGFVLSWNWRMHLKVLRLHCFLNVSSDYMYLKHLSYSTNQNITLKMRRARYGISKSVNTDIQFSFELSLLFIHMLNKYLPEVAGDRFFIYNSL